MDCVLLHSAGANLFHGMLATAVAGERCLCDLKVMVPKPCSSSSNSLIIGIYPAIYLGTSARKPVLIYVPCIQNNSFTPMPDVRSQMRIFSTLVGSLSWAIMCVAPYGWCQSVFDGWVVAEWLAHRPPIWVTKGVPQIQVHGFETTLHIMEQFVGNCHSPCFQFTQMYCHASSMRNKTNYPHPHPTTATTTTRGKCGGNLLDL